MSYNSRLHGLALIFFLFGSITSYLWDHTSIMKRGKHDNFFLIEFIHQSFTEILAKSPLYQEVPSYRQTTCTLLLFITQSHPNHPKS
jgi:hypothetical protein